jgi:curved DNA-binding protein CbpA
MVNHYKVLKVSPKASSAEIKSAYRRLARKLHPDVNGNSQKNRHEFAEIAKAYEILGNPKTRADYDQRMLQAEYSTAGSGSVFSSDNQHARRWRQMAYERRYNEIIDRMIADERRETIALQKVIFPTVALFLSTLFVAIFKPLFWTKSELAGKVILLSLFIAGVFHLAGRIRAGLDKFTYSENLHDSILEESEPETKPFTRFKAITFLLVGFCASLGLGLSIGYLFSVSIDATMPSLFSAEFRPEIIFSPPIAVLLVDLMHAVASKFEY